MPELFVKTNRPHNVFGESRFPQLIAVVSKRDSGNMSLAYGDTSQAIMNRRNFLESLNVDYRNLICLRQAHGSKIIYVSEKDKGKGALSFNSSADDADALVTDKKNLPLAIFTADCLSIFLYDKVIPAIGLVHAGWRGAKEGIAAKAVVFMQEKFNSRPEGIYAGFGPAIKQCCYKVSQEFEKYFGREVIKRGGYYYLDLSQVNKQQLLEAGLRQENISASLPCTSCNSDEFFSYRREKNAAGRMMAVMMLK